ncbi:MAG: methyltransferase domain-containing protein [Candidatus Electrothrix sp. ATG2]|nr:methyltransferase domain-containing protein [Candidatus Electrothrix sp. ATG2]
MNTSALPAPRYKEVTRKKSEGATFTPKDLSDFVAKNIVIAAQNEVMSKKKLRILDPAVGEGELLLSLIGELHKSKKHELEVFGFDQDKKSLSIAKSRIEKKIPNINLKLENIDFLDFVISETGQKTLWCSSDNSTPTSYDLIIANPPYVRTQIMGANKARKLSQNFNLTGRVDLYYAFILGISKVLDPKGTTGIIVSNRFMTTKSGGSVRKAILNQFNLNHIYDLGDTKLFDVAVLPSVLIASGTETPKSLEPKFTSIYETTAESVQKLESPIEAINKEGIVSVNDGRVFEVQQGILDVNKNLSSVWRIHTKSNGTWLSTVRKNSIGSFRDIGKIRVGVKTCADKVFIRSDWNNETSGNIPEVLCPLITHHIARRYKSLSIENQLQILYPHKMLNGKRKAIDLEKVPNTKKYLAKYRQELESRKYVIEAGRGWYEIWVPQDPSAWEKTKLIFRDISAEPTFWVDESGGVVNGDCYWLTCNNGVNPDMLWLAAAIGNSTFIEEYYDHMFKNKLYAGRRRFITQYVEKFPLIDPDSNIGQDIIRLVKEVYSSIDSQETVGIQEEIDGMVWRAFGLSGKKVYR